MKKKAADATWLKHPDEYSYYDTPEFREYITRIEKILVSKKIVSKKPYVVHETISLRELHDTLGGAANPRWTLDALFWVDDVEEVNGAMTRWRIQRRPKGEIIPLNPLSIIREKEKKRAESSK